MSIDLVCRGYWTCYSKSVNCMHSYCFAFLVLAGSVSSADDLQWPEFRGPQGNGISTSRGLPTEFGETNHVVWKTAIHGRGWSSPVIWGKQVWLTTATPDGHQLFAVCVDRETGKVLRDLLLFTVEKPQFVHEFNSHASPTPALAGGRAFITFGASGTACLDSETGEVLWERRDIECNHFRGAGSSPILGNGLLYLNFDGSDHQFVIALDQKTGKTVWRTERSVDFKDLTPQGKPEGDGDYRKAFATCQIGTFGGLSQLISEGSKAIYAYDPMTGKELWRIDDQTTQAAGTRPVIGQNMVFIPTGWSVGQLLAFKPGMPGEVVDANKDSKTDGQLQVVWKSKRSIPKKPSLTFFDGLLYAIDDNGVATCWEAATGKVVWNERIGGNYSASPLLADGHLYFCSEEGKVTVIRTGAEFKKEAETTFGSGFMASPAVSGRALYLRSRTHLYQIEN